MAAKIFSGPRQKRGLPILDLLGTGCRGHPCAPGQVFFFYYEPIIPINPAARKAPGRPLNSPATGTPEKAAGVPDPGIPTKEVITARENQIYRYVLLRCLPLTPLFRDVWGPSRTPKALRWCRKPG